MEDLLVANIRFLNDLGTEIPWQRFAKQRPGLVEMLAVPLQRLSFSKAKERFVKAIVRKHLVSQGMKVEGARVEICSAYT
jgi:hypothetical protein